MWIILSVSAAAFHAIGNAFAKKGIKSCESTNFSAFAVYTTAGVVLGIVSFFQGKLFPGINNEIRFWQGMIGAVVLMVIAMTFLYKALKIADLGHVMSFYNLTPALVVLPAVVILKEIPSVTGLLGIILTTSGAVLMEYKNGGKEKSDQDNANSKGVRYLLMAVSAAVMVPVALKIAIIESTASFTTFLVLLLTGISFGILVLFFKEFGTVIETVKTLKNGATNTLAIFFLAGISAAVEWESMNRAFTMADVSYVMAIKRTMPLFALMIGYFYFGEKLGGIKKIAATALLIAGAAIVSLFG